LEIKIDTKKDSPEDIKKTIEFLKTLVGASSIMNGNEFNASNDASSGMVGLFGDTPVLSNEQSSSGGDDNEDEEEKDKVEIIPY